jgi:hypothetical protein
VLAELPPDPYLDLGAALWEAPPRGPPLLGRPCWGAGAHLQEGGSTDDGSANHGSRGGGENGGEKAGEKAGENGGEKAGENGGEKAGENGGSGSTAACGGLCQVQVGPAGGGTHASKGGKRTPEDVAAAETGRQGSSGGGGGSGSGSNGALARAAAAAQGAAGAGGICSGRSSGSSDGRRGHGGLEDAVAVARWGDLELRGCHFAYPTRPAAPVLEGLALTLPCGRVTALVGR